MAARRSRRAGGRPSLAGALPPPARAAAGGPTRPRESSLNKASCAAAGKRKLPGRRTARQVRSRVGEELPLCAVPVAGS
jgi:hypothetical protein